MRALALAFGLVLVTALAAGALAAPAAGPRLVQVVEGLDSPVFVTQAPGEPGRLYVVEQGGLVKVVSGGRVRSTFLDVRGLVVSGGEQGLLGLAFPPDYRRSRFVYANFSAKRDGATIVARFRVSGGRALPATRVTLLRVPQPYANHNGGHLAFGPDGRLWVGLGDGGSAGDPENRAQNPDTLLGKLFRLDVATRKPTPDVVGIGLRNPWRYSFDRATGDLWIGDVGQNRFEEIDVLRRGASGLVNFGWDVFEGLSAYESKALGPGRLVKPVAVYSHDDGCSVTGGYVYRGRAVPSLRGRYLFGDYCARTIWSMPAGGGAPRVEPISTPALVSFGQDLAGELYVVSHEGRVYRIAT